MIYTSSPLVVRADTSVAECIRLMKDNNVGAVLIVSDNSDQILIGIFTERDLLKKIELIHQGNHWLSPVRTVMTSPVKTLEYSQLHAAGKIMLQHRFRHLPIVSKEDGTERLLGIISMRDLFLHMLVEKEKQALSSQDTKGIAKLRIFLITKNEPFSKFIEQVFHSLVSAQVRRITPDGDYGRKVATIIFDIDGFEKEIWPKRLVEMNKDTTVRLIIVAFDPAKHSDELVQTIEKLGKSKKFWIFKKPLEVFDLINRIKAG